MSPAVIHDLQTGSRSDSQIIDAPLIAGDVDLRDFQRIWINIPRLMKSKTWLGAKRNPELGFYAMNLWLRAWNEVPAGSIEDDDDVLADAAMCNPERWAAVKTEVLRSWKLCTLDGRWYNPTVCEIAQEAWTERLKYRERSAKGHAARWPKDGGKHASGMRKGEGEGKGDSGASPRSARSILFGEGVPRLVQMSGKSDKSARSYIGLLLTQMRDDAAFVSASIATAHTRWTVRDTELADPIAWITGQIKQRAVELGYPVLEARGRAPKVNPETQRIQDLLDTMEGGSEEPGQAWEPPRGPTIEGGEG